jgi:hypothetical protein
MPNEELKNRVMAEFQSRTLLLDPTGSTFSFHTQPWEHNLIGCLLASSLEVLSDLHGFYLTRPRHISSAHFPLPANVKAARTS